jgi:SAM-dependent methyltransferase
MHDQGYCRVCGGKLTCYPARRQLSLARCTLCGVVCLEPQPAATQLARRFRGGYFTGGEVDSYSDYRRLEPSYRRHSRSLLRRIGALVGSRVGSLIEIGCAAGYFLDEARRQGWQVAGLEPNEDMARIAHEELGIDVCTTTLHDAPHIPPADVVVLLNALEHITRPREVESRLHEMVRPGGLLFIETWDSDSLVARMLGEHWHQWSPLVPYYYTHGSLDALFPPERWEPLDWRKGVKRIPLWRGLEILGRGVRAGRKQSVPWRWDVLYFAGDLVNAAYHRR